MHTICQTAISAGCSYIEFSWVQLRFISNHCDRTWVFRNHCIELPNCMLCVAYGSNARFMVIGNLFYNHCLPRILHQLLGRYHFAFWKQSCTPECAAGSFTQSYLRLHKGIHTFPYTLNRKLITHSFITNCYIVKHSRARTQTVKCKQWLVLGNTSAELRKRIEIPQRQR